MRKAKRTILIAMLISVVTVPVCSAQTARSKGKPKHPTALELLDKYAQTQDKLRSYISKFETLEDWNFSCSGEYEWLPKGLSGKKQTFHYTEWHRDGQRFKQIRKNWGKLIPRNGHALEDKDAWDVSTLWDGNNFYNYAKNKLPGRPDQLFLHIDRKDWNNDSTNEWLAYNNNGAAMKGFFPGDLERVDSILRRADKMSVREKMDIVGGVKCYVIDALTKRGKYKLWIAPEHGYNIVQAKVQRSPGDIAYKGPVQKGRKRYVALKNVRFEKIDNTWIPMAAEIEDKSICANGEYGIRKWFYKQTEIILNPDHDALGSFLPYDITNGSTVVLVTGETSRRLRWQDGKIVDKDGREVEVDRPIKAESKQVKKSEPKRK